MTYRDATEEAEKLLDVLKMSHAKHRNTQNLSGGMKRKLSLGIAIVGGSKVSRKIWDQINMKMSNFWENQFPLCKYYILFWLK